MTAREFLNQHLGHSATVEWDRSGFSHTSQQPIEFSGQGVALRSCRDPFNLPVLLLSTSDLGGPLIAIDCIRAVYCCGEHWSAE